MISVPGGGAAPFFVKDASSLTALTGVLRLATGAKRVIAWRDAANLEDIRVLDIDAAGSVYIGTGQAFAGADQTPGVNIYAAVTVALGIGASTMLYLIGTNVEHLRPAIGSSSGSSPWGATDGQVVVAVAGSNIVLSAAQYCTRAQKFTGTLGAQRTITYPLPANDAESYSKLVWCNTATNGILVTNGGGLTVAIAAGSIMRNLWFTPAGVVQQT